MKIRVKGLAAEVEMEFPDKDHSLGYDAERIKSIITHMKESVIQIEKELKNDNNGTSVPPRAK